MSDAFGGGLVRGIRQSQTAAFGGRRSAQEMLEDLVEQNNAAAADNRAYFDSCGVLVVNLMSSPGAGKTALLEATIDALKHEFNLAVIEGDAEGASDAKRMQTEGVPAIQVNTGCCGHLDARTVYEASQDLPLGKTDILFVENVGNLISPADFDLGQHCSITLLSVPEGDEKLAKYPKVFRAADLVLITKTDLLHFMRDFSPRRVEHGLRALGSVAPVLGVSSSEGGGLDIWFNWLRREVAAHQARLAPRSRTSPFLQAGVAGLGSMSPDYGRQQRCDRPGVRAAGR
jgi:hydrogenase nickel incorporation protein HypB